ncbi:protein NCBP2AS2 homolog [Liolophura sinensis]|uniref:protein NCBP2AS2 homolog n=1 Tax=Liolophura sinensis TaxID=3198878 RepID=UPI003158B512
MVLRAILGYLSRNEQLIQKLADSYPMRRAAQMTAFLFFKGKEIGEESMHKLKDSEAMNRLREEAKISGSRFNTFTKEIKDGFKEISDDIKRRQR